MDLSELNFVELGEQDLDIEFFDCGREDINDFFKFDAQDYQEELFGKTYFFCLPDNPNRVVAAFTVANASIFTKHLPNSRRKKIGYEVHHEKGLINYPAVLLGRLGVDKAYRGNHLGAHITNRNLLIFIERMGLSCSFLPKSRNLNTVIGIPKKTALYRRD